VGVCEISFTSYHVCNFSIWDTCNKVWFDLIWFDLMCVQGNEGGWGDEEWWYTQRFRIHLLKEAVSISASPHILLTVIFDLLLSVSIPAAEAYHCAKAFNTQQAALSVIHQSGLTLCSYHPDWSKRITDAVFWPYNAFSFSLM
jgi:hypothetical protein